MTYNRLTTTPVPKTLTILYYNDQQFAFADSS